MQPVDVATFVVLALASGRVAFALTRDEIFRPLREWVWLRSSPEEGTILERSEDGDSPRPARFYHLTETKVQLVPDSELTGTCADFDRFEDYAFDPGLGAREPGFFGQLLECPYCMSFWTSLAACAAWLTLGSDVLYPALPLALWGASNSFAVKGL